MAARYLLDNERHNGMLPESGGIEEQPYEWKLLLDIAYAALDQAKADIQAEEEEERRREQEAEEARERGEAPSMDYEDYG